MESILQQMVEAKKHEDSNTLKDVKRLCKELGLTSDMIKGSLEKERVEN